MTKYEPYMNRCAICKGYKLLCGKRFCPILRKLSLFKSIYSSVRFDKEIFGPSPPAIFVGSRGYPYVTFSPLVPLTDSDASKLSDPLKWHDVTLDEAVKLRLTLVMGEKKVHVKSDVDFDELAMSIKPVDAEMILRRKPRIRIKLDDVSPIVNPSAELEKLILSENPKIPNFVEKVVSDEIGAKDSILALYEKGFEEYYIIRLFSSGLLGINKKIVPTRWSITAVEDTIGEQIKREIVEYDWIDRFEIYFSEFVGNRYVILMMPNSYSFELLEVWLPNSIFGFSGVLRDYELFKKRGYAKETSGAYYSARLSVLEFLKERRRQARTIVFREITQDYYIPIGSWQIRVGVKKALEKRVGEFDSLASALEFLKDLLIHPLSDYVKRSELLSLSSILR